MRGNCIKNSIKKVVVQNESDRMEFEKQSKLDVFDRIFWSLSKMLPNNKAKEDLSNSKAIATF